MKLLQVAAIFAFVALARASDPALWRTWHDGAERVAAPVTELYVDGEQLRNDTITSVDKYLLLLETDIERQYAWGVNDILQPSGLRFREIVDMQVLVSNGVATADQFDYQLWYLARIYDIVVSLARQAEDSVRTPFSSEALSRGIRQAMGPAPRAGAAPRYTLSQLFFNLESALLQRDFALLRNWLLETFDAGLQAVEAAAPLMEENYRQKYLWTTVASLQRDSTTVSKYDAALEEHSTRVYWEDYVRARAELWAVEAP